MATRRKALHLCAKCWTKVEHEKKGEPFPGGHYLRCHGCQEYFRAALTTHQAEDPPKTCRCGRFEKIEDCIACMNN